MQWKFPTDLSAVQNALQFVFALRANQEGLIRTTQFMTLYDIIVPDETGSYLGEKNICKEIQPLVIDSCMGQCR
jgi:hypothetical protein